MFDIFNEMADLGVGVACGGSTNPLPSPAHGLSMVSLERKYTYQVQLSAKSIQELSILQFSPFLSLSWFLTNYWKCNPSSSVASVGWFVCNNFLKGWEFTLSCSFRSTCYNDSFPVMKNGNFCNRASCISTPRSGRQCERACYNGRTNRFAQ